MAACVYELDVQQGNKLEPEDIEKIEVGMTRSQVRFVLGTPVVGDSCTMIAGTTSITSNRAAADKAGAALAHRLVRRQCGSGDPARRAAGQKNRHQLTRSTTHRSAAGSNLAAGFTRAH